MGEIGPSAETCDHADNDCDGLVDEDGAGTAGALQNACGGCQTIQLLMVGPDTRQGFVSNTPRTLADITPTIGLLMGFPTELATGVPMAELLVEPLLP